MNTKIDSRNVRFGTVKFFDFLEGYGRIIPDGGGSDVHFRVEAGRRIVVGDEGPAFAFGRIPAPYRGAVVAFVLPPGMSTVSGWGYKFYYDGAKQRASKIPVIRIVHQDSFKNDRSERPVRVDFGGAMLPALIRQLQAGQVEFHSRVVDGPKTTVQWFQEQQLDGKWVRVKNELTLATLYAYNKSAHALAA